MLKNQWSRCCNYLESFTTFRTHKVGFDMVVANVAGNLGLLGKRLHAPEGFLEGTVKHPVAVKPTI